MAGIAGISGGAGGIGECIFPYLLWSSHTANITLQNVWVTHKFFILKRVLHDLISIQCAVEATGYYNIEHQFLSMHAQMPKQSAHCC